jgi:hypothetical protein
MKRYSLIAATAVLSLLGTVANATVLVYEGFHEGDWTGITATGGQQLQNGKTTGNYSTGFAVNSKWSVADNTTQLSVSGTDYGLSLPAIMMTKGFSTCGGAVQCNPSGGNSQLRGGCHAFTANTLKVSSGALYVRALLQLDSSAAAKLASVSTPAGNADGSYYGFGLIGSTSASRYGPTTTSNKSSCTFLMWKNSSGEYVLSLCLIDASGTLTHYPLVTGVTFGSTYLCYAEINVGVGTDGAEFVRAGAVDTADFTGAATWAALNGTAETIEVQLITDSYYPKAMAFAGPYATNGGRFRADELVVGTEMGDILPADGIFAVSPSGSPTVGTNSFSTSWMLVTDAGMTADAGIVMSLDETFTTATTNSLGTGLSADTRTASVTGLEPGTTYWWKIYADNGTEVAETPVASFRTTGSPIFGNASATVTEQSAAFSVELAEAAMENTLPTSVSVFYGTNGVDWTELPLGTASAAETFSDTAEDLGYGVTYQWFARATATLEGGRVLSASTSTNSFTLLWSGDMFVDATSANAIPPYVTPASAAQTIADALALATDGATIHIAPGLYKISTPIALAKAIRILGEGGDPSHVVVSNTVGANYQNGNRRVFILNHADAFVANLTMQKGSAWGDWATGGNFLISDGGGTVSNCIVEAGQQVSGHGSGGGGQLEAGLVTHTVFRGNYVAASTQWGQNKGGVLVLKGASRAENCLLVDNPQPNAALLVVQEGTSILRNCTIIKSRIANTNQYCTSFSPLRIGSTAQAVNVVIAGVTDKDGAACKPTGTRANFTNGALDSSIEGTAFPASTVVGTAASFFRDYANGDFRPASGGPLVGKGANYEGMAAFDLSGKQKRLIGRIIDIGCFEANDSHTIFFIR